MLGPKLGNEVDRLARAGKVDEAMKLIDAIHKMNPPLASKFADKIQELEQDLRGRAPAPRSAIGNIQDSVGSGQ